LPHKPPTHTTNPHPRTTKGEDPPACINDPCINDQDTNNQRYFTLQTKHTQGLRPRGPPQQQGPTLSCACSRPLSNNQTTRSPTSTQPPPSRSSGV
jgi:hypothetical protein